MLNENAGGHADREAGKISRATPLYLQAYRRIREDIVRGVLAPGQKLSNQLLSDALGISRTPVREAVSALIKDGILQGSPNSTVRVFSPTPGIIATVYPARAVLEGAAAATIASFPGEARADALRHLAERVEVAGRAIEGNSLDAAMANTQFHRALVELSRNQVLVDLYEPLSVKAYVCRRESLRQPQHPVRAVEQHRELLRVFERGDPRLAKDAIERHILLAGLLLLDVVEGSAPAAAETPDVSSFRTMASALVGAATGRSAE